MSLKNKRILYIVEGECEEHLIKVIKNTHIYSGKVKKFNIAQDILSPHDLRLIKAEIIVIVFDTDINNKLNVDRVHKNIKKLKQLQIVKKVLFIPQILHFEDELVFATTASNAWTLTRKATKNHRKFKEA